MSLFASYEDSLCVFYCSCWKSIDLINLENACEYFATKSLLLVGQGVCRVCSHGVSNWTTTLYTPQDETPVPPEGHYISF